MRVEQKINTLIGLAKAAGRYIEQGRHTETDYGKETYERLKAYYDAFCELRHDEPALNNVMTVDVLKTLIARYDKLFVTMWEDEEHHQERVQELERIRDTFAAHGLVIGLGNSKAIVTLPEEATHG